MGLIRLVLAVSVLSLHIGPILGLTFAGGSLPVQSFYMISGFYIALILTEKYGALEKPYYYFLTNRLIKLYPLYWTVLLSTIFIGLVSFVFLRSNFIFGDYVENSTVLTFKDYLVFILFNLSLIGQDLLFFLGVDKGSGDFLFILNYPESQNMKAHHFLFVGQAWTISLEITFYLIAPFLNKLTSRNLVAIVFLSLLARVGGYQLGLSERPWNYQFFPFELALFILGMLAYRIYKQNFERIELITKAFPSLTKVSLAFFVLMTLFYREYFSHPFTYILFLALLFLSLPLLFASTRYNNLDRVIGELSYPVYMWHILIGYLVSYFMPKTLAFGLVVLISTLLVSYLFNVLIQRKLEGYRNSRLQRVITNKLIA